MDFEAQDEAVLAKILVPAGTPDVAVGTPMMVLTESIDDVAAFKDFKPEGGVAASAPAPADAPASPPTPAPTASPAQEQEAAPTPSPAPTASAKGGRVAASPLAKKVLCNPCRVRGLHVRDRSSQTPWLYLCTCTGATRWMAHRRGACVEGVALRLGCQRGNVLAHIVNLACTKLLLKVIAAGVGPSGMPSVTSPLVVFVADAAGGFALCSRSQTLPSLLLNTVFCIIFYPVLSGAQAVILAQVTSG